MPSDDEDTPNEFAADVPTRPDGGPALVEKQQQEETTKPHDTKEWLHGFERGRIGGTADVLNALLTELLARNVVESEARAFVARVHMRAKGLPVGSV